jgi:hypothetical protein
MAAVKSGAGWFLTISILSGINSILQILDMGIRFIFGLGVTQVVDAIAHGRGSEALVPMALLDGLFLGMLLLCWHFAKSGSRGAFLLGLIAYALDGVLLLLFRDWLSAGFHAYALFRIGQGYMAARQLARMAQHAPATGTIEPT